MLYKFLQFKARTGPKPYNRKYMSQMCTKRQSLYQQHFPSSENMATAILNNWRDFLPLRVTVYAKLINKN